MEYNNVAEIFEAIDKTREQLKQKVSNLTDEQKNSCADGWSVAEIAEHIGIVGGGINQIIAKLLAGAEISGVKSDGTFNPPISLVEQIASIQDKKLQAPERVHPQGNQTVAEALAKLDENRLALTELRPRIEAVDSSNAKFPHPFFGDINLYQWLALAGLHEYRHLRQIEKVLAEKV